MIEFVDSWLDRVTMYRLTLYYVVALLAAAFTLGFFKAVPADPTALVFSSFVILLVCWATNRAFAAAFGAPVNPDSVFITVAILALIMAPTTASDHWGLAALALASVAAIASKWLLAIHRRHLFNPVAFGAMAAGLALNQPASWWVGGNAVLAPLVIAGGLLVVRKVRRFDMIGVYLLANVAATLATTQTGNYIEALRQTAFGSPLLFAGFAMLTEPLTSPAAKWPRLAFGALVGSLTAADVNVAGYYFSPEAALLVGNAFAWAVSPKGRFRLTLVAIEKMAAGCYDYVFASDRAIAFAPGQYLDWTLDVPRPDDRGNRRPFTIASAPGAETVRLGVKFYPGPSAFKRALAKMKPGDPIFASHVAGEFTLPRNPDEKIAFIAGGIGVTPFRSMVEEMVERGQSRPLVMFYGNNRLDEIAYADLFQRAHEELGMRTIYAIAEDAPDDIDNVHPGLIDVDLIQREMPDFMERTFYLSGPRAMVLKFQALLKELGVARRRIKVDYFPGFA